MKRLTIAEEVIVKCAISEYVSEAEKRLPRLEAKRGTFETEEDEERLEEVIGKCQKRIHCGKELLKKVMV